MAKNLIESLGRDYFNERYVGALMQYEGNVVSVRGAVAGGQVQANILIERGGRTLKTAVSVQIPADRFTGFEVFRSPELGYRKIGDSCYFMRHVLGRNHASAFFADRFTMIGSRGTRYLENLGGLTPVRSADHNTIAQLFYPVYDSINKWELLVEGKESSLVLSNKIAIEPSTRTDDEAYEISYDNVIIGAVDAKKKVRARTPTFNSQLINRILKQ